VPKPTFTLEEIVKNQAYFLKPKHLQFAFFEYLKNEFQRNRIVQSKNRKEKFEILKRDILKKLEHLKIANTKKALLMQQFNIALRKAAIQAGIKKSIKKSLELKRRLMRLRRILMRRRLRRLRMRRRLEAIEEFEDMIAMHKLQLERDYEHFIKKLEEEKKKYAREKSEQTPSEVANNLTENIVGLCEILPELLEIDKKTLLPKLKKDKEALKNDFLYLELILKSEIEDSNEFDKKMLDIVDILEEIYNTARKEIADDNIEKNQILDKWCKLIEMNILNWLNNEYIERFNEKNKEKAILNLTQNM